MWLSATLLGLFYKDLLFYQDCHYKDIGSRRTGTAWGKHVAIKCWNCSIRFEMGRGVRSLPTGLYLRHFQHTEDKVMDWNIDDKKAWFLLF